MHLQSLRRVQQCRRSRHPKHCDHSSATILSLANNLFLDSRQCTHCHLQSSRGAYGLKIISDFANAFGDSLLTGPKVELCVGERPNLDHIFLISAQLLSYFSKALRGPLQGMKHGGKVVIPETNKKAASSVFRWMLAGGLDKGFLNAPSSNEDPVAMLVERLNLVIRLGIDGPVESKLFLTLRTTISRGQFKLQHVDLMYKTLNLAGVEAMGNRVAKTVVQAVLDGEKCGIPGGATHQKFKEDITTAVHSKAALIHWMQTGRDIPLTTFQIGFLYIFAPEKSTIKKTIANDLLGLIDAGLVSNHDQYKAHARKYPDFNHEMTEAMIAKDRQEAYWKRANGGILVKHFSTASNPKTALTIKHQQAAHTPKPKDSNIKEKNIARPKGQKNVTFALTKPQLKQGKRIPPHSRVPIKNRKATKADDSAPVATGTTLNKAQALALAKNIEALLPAKKLDSTTILRLTENGAMERER